MLAIAPEAINLPKGSSSSLTESEFQYTTRMIQTNLSNFSAWHHRSRLIPRLLDERGADSSERRKILEEELSLICTAINTDPFDQSIWYYQRFLMSTLSPGCPRHDGIALDLTNHDRQDYYAHEINYIREILEDESDVKIDMIRRQWQYFVGNEMRPWSENKRRFSGRGIVIPGDLFMPSIMVTIPLSINCLQTHASGNLLLSQVLRIRFARPQSTSCAAALCTESP